MLIQEMRNRSKGIAAKIIVGLIIVVFALFGFGSIQTFLTPVPKVATVNGDDIPEQEMQISIERQRRILMANGQTSVNDIDDDKLRQDVLDELIERRLLTQASDDLGLYYSESKIDQAIIATESFRIDGKFDPQQFQLVVRSVGYTPVGYRELVREESRYRQIATALAGSEFATTAEIDRVARLSRQTRDVAYMIIPGDQAAVEASLTDQAIADYYEANIADFVTPEAVKLEYVELTKSSLMDEVQVELSDLQIFYEDEKLNYTRPEEKRAAHILIEINDDVTDEIAREKIDEIHQRIKNGEDFEALAREFSQDSGSAKKGGDLGFNPEGTFVEAFELALADLSLNQMSEPVLTEFGYHLIKLLEIQPLIVPEFEEIQARLEVDFREMKAEEIFVERSAELNEMSFETAGLVDLAAQLVLEVRTTDWIDQSTNEGLAANARIREAAFSQDLLVDGNNSELIELDPDHHVVVRVANHRPSGRRELAEAESDIRELLARQMAQEIAREKMGDALAMLRGGSITRFVADKFGSRWQVRSDLERTSPDVDRAIIESAFKLPRPPEGDKSLGAVMLDNGDAVVVTVTKVTDRDIALLPKLERDTLARLLAQGSGDSLYQHYRAKLKEEADIEYQ